ncbi:MAG: HEAT repeat domain-containing protein, partial [Elusimicrobiota bacterium]
EAELVTTPEKEVGRKLLEQFLDDRDIKVRCRAILALYKYDPEKALAKLTLISRSMKKENRIHSIRVLGDIATDRAAELLLEMLNDSEDDVKREAIKEIYKIHEMEKSELSSSTQNKIESALEKFKSIWVIK